MSSVARPHPNPPPRRGEGTFFSLPRRGGEGTFFSLPRRGGEGILKFAVRHVPPHPNPPPRRGEGDFLFLSPAKGGRGCFAENHPFCVSH